MNIKFLRTGIFFLLVSLYLSCRSVEVDKSDKQSFNFEGNYSGRDSFGNDMTLSLHSKSDTIFINYENVVIGDKKTGETLYLNSPPDSLDFAGFFLKTEFRDTMICSIKSHYLMDEALHEVRLICMDENNIHWKLDSDDYLYLPEDMRLTRQKVRGKTSKAQETEKEEKRRLRNE